MTVSGLEVINDKSGMCDIVPLFEHRKTSNAASHVPHFSADENHKSTIENRIR